MERMRALIAASALAFATSKSCKSVISSGDSFTGVCSDEWATIQTLIKPTQPQVGYAWISYKLDKDFSTESDAQSAMDEAPTPAGESITNSLQASRRQKLLWLTFTYSDAPKDLVAIVHCSKCAQYGIVCIRDTDPFNCRTAVGALADLRHTIRTTFTAVLGTDASGNDAMYVVDDHHTLCALDLSGFDAVTVSLNILCDLRHLDVDAFWGYLAANNLTFLASHVPTSQPNTLPVPITPKDMPTTFEFTTAKQTLTDDSWRSLAGFSRKVKDAPSPAPSCSDYKYCERCMYRGCSGGSALSGPSVPFFEFRWSYYMLSAYLDASWWPSPAEYSEFQSSYEALPAVVIGHGSVDTDAWLDTAGKLIALCRGANTGAFVLPDTMFQGDGSLPGYVQGYEELDADPTCDAPVCGAS